MAENWSVKHKETVLRLKKPGADILKTLTPEDCDFIHMAGCLPGEAAELYDAVEDPSTNEQVEEFGDFEFYLVAVRSFLGIERSVVRESDEVIDPEKYCIELMRYSGHLWDVVKRVTVYRKSMFVPDPKYADKSLHEAAVEFIRQIESHFYALMTYEGLTLDDVLQANWEKLASADKGRYATGSYSDSQAQDRRDKTR